MVNPHPVSNYGSPPAKLERNLERLPGAILSKLRQERHSGRCGRQRRRVWSHVVDCGELGKMLGRVGSGAAEVSPARSSANLNKMGPNISFKATVAMASARKPSAETRELERDAAG